MVLVDALTFAQPVPAAPERSYASRFDAALTRANILVHMFLHKNGTHSGSTFCQYAGQYLEEATAKLPTLTAEIEILLSLCINGLHPLTTISKESLSRVFIKLPAILANQSIPAERAIDTICKMSLLYYSEIEGMDNSRLFSIMLPTLEWYVAMYKNEMWYKNRISWTDDEQLISTAHDSLLQFSIPAAELEIFEARLRHRLRQEDPR